MKKILLSAMLIAMSLGAYAQVGIGTQNPNASAVLDLTSNNKGLLLPRVSLVSTTTASPLANHVAGMFIYNTASVNDVTPGYYLNNGSEWIRSASSVKDLVSVMKTPSESSLIVSVEGSDIYYDGGNGWVDNVVITVPGLNDTLDTENAFNSATGEFVAPEDGFYFFTGKVTLAISTNDAFDGNKGLLVAYLNVDANTGNTITIDQNWIDVFKGVKNAPRNSSAYISAFTSLKQGDVVTLRFKTHQADDLSENNTGSTGVLLRGNSTNLDVYKF